MILVDIDPLCWATQCSYIQRVSCGKKKTYGDDANSNARPSAIEIIGPRYVAKTKVNFDVVTKLDRVASCSKLEGN